MRTASIVLGVTTLLSAPALAEDELVPTLHAHESAATGAFLPLLDSPAMRATTVKTFGLYDGARDRTALGIDAQAKLSARIQLKASATYEADDLASLAALQVAVLESDKQGMDLQLEGGWTESGVNQVSAVFVGVSAGKDLGGSYLFGTSRLDIGTEQSERGLALGLGSMRALVPGIYAGANTQLNLDLERDTDEPMDESSWSLLTGPALTYAADRFSVTATAGVALDKPRTESRELGAFGSVGFGAAF